MMRSLFTAVSGLENHQTRMDVIGNNIANVNTTGFKASRVNFQDTLSQTLSGASAPTDNIGGINPKQVGLGMSVASIDKEMGHGSVQATGNTTDLAIDTDAGFFIIKNGPETYYTRNGDFSLDATGNLVMNGSGMHVQGWNAKEGAKSVSTNGAPTNIAINMNSSMPAQATSSVIFNGNLSADSQPKTIASIVATNDKGAPVTGQGPFSIGTNGVTNIELTFTDGTTASGIPSGGTANGKANGYKIGQQVCPSNTSMITLFDSLGGKHAVPAYFERQIPASANKWTVSVPAGTYDGATITKAVTETVTFDGKTGKWQSGAPLQVNFTVPNVDGSMLPASVSMQFSNMTQYVGVTNANNTSNGYPTGFYKDMTIGQDGVITASYSNGQRLPVAQIAIATFNNSAGLTKEGQSLYATSNNSGQPRVGTFAAEGVTVTPGALEMSNVDIAKEFSNMIVTQRGFQANSKVITTSDEMLETLIQMKR